MAGAPVTVISKLPGHSSTAVTSRYPDHLTNAQAAAVLEGVSLPPLEGGQAQPRSLVVVPAAME